MRIGRIDAPRLRVNVRVSKHWVRIGRLACFGAHWLTS